MGQLRELIEEVRRAFVDGDFDGFPAIVHPDAEIRNPFTVVHGPDGFADLGRGFTAACSERRIAVVDVVESGDAAVAEIRVTARHTGPLPVAGGEAPPTGVEIGFAEAAVVRADGGRIVSWHSYYDGLAFARQVGLAPPAAAG
jgi:ketosteroid isomerase-like protein